MVGWSDREANTGRRAGKGGLLRRFWISPSAVVRLRALGLVETSGRSPLRYALTPAGRKLVEARGFECDCGDVIEHAGASMCSTCEENIVAVGKEAVDAYR